LAQQIAHELWKLTRSYGRLGRLRSP
jgi:hypothetical protein